MHNFQFYTGFQFQDCLLESIISQDVEDFKEFNLLNPTSHVIHQQFNPLNTKRRLLYLKTKFVPRSKYFSYRL